MDKDQLRQTCAERLASSRIQAKLVEVFAFYFYDVQEIMHFASVQLGGERPPNLTNEIFSCFHHIARGLCIGDTVTRTLGECDGAANSHLMRATLDSYKMAIHCVVQKDRQLKKVLDFLVLVDDFEKYVPDGIAKIHEINTISNDMQRHHVVAKVMEAQGKHDLAIQSFKAALDKAKELSEKILVFTGNETYLLACAREARERNERKKDRRNVILAALISACASSILTAVCTLGIPIWFSDSPTVGDPHQANNPPTVVQSGQP